MDIDKRRQFALQTLGQLGWSSDLANTNCIGSKQFQILDGIEKQALIWAEPWRSEDVLVIKAEYYSEGNNILASHHLKLTSVCTEADIKSGIEEFVEAAEAEIDCSFGRQMRM